MWAKRGVLAFLMASIQAIPTGRQNTFAAHNLPSFIAVAVHEGQPVSLANAFEVPVKAGQHGLAAASVLALQKHADLLREAYGLDLDFDVMDLTGAWQGDSKNSLKTLLASVATKLGAEA